MTELLEKAVEAVRQMPPEQQDAIARWMLNLSDDDAPEPLDADDLAAIEDGLAQIERGEFATDEEIAANFSVLHRTVNVRLTRRALQDIDRIAAYIRTHHRVAAVRDRDDIQACFDLIASHPEVGRKAQRGTRRLMVPRSPHVIVNRLNRSESVAVIVTIRHAARRPEPGSA